MSKSPTLYDQAVNISEEYLGPAGERFMRRQITTHLGIQPEDLHQRDVHKLVDWACLAFALLTDDLREVESFSNSLLLLTPNQNRTKNLHGTAARE